jgi:hypothetical protein
MPGPPWYLSPASKAYDFLPATTAALVALIASKSDTGTFVINATAPGATNQRFSGYASYPYGKPRGIGPLLTFPPHLALLVRPASAATAVLYTWQTTYRQRTQGSQLVADQSQDNIARGLLAQQALDWMNAVDLRYPVSPTPNPNPDIAGVPQPPG